MKFVEHHNQRAWDALARRKSVFARPAGDADFAHPEKIVNPFGWLGRNLSGFRVLCLAAGGGKHGPVFASVGAEVTVADLSSEMLEVDRRVAAERGLNLRTLRTSMSHLDGLGDGQFDVVVQPVSTCYVADLGAVYREVSRVLAPGGVYLSQHKQPVSLQTGELSDPKGFRVLHPYYQERPLPQTRGGAHREAGTVEFIHRLEPLLGGLCQAGFVIEDVREPNHGDPAAPPSSFRYRSYFIPPYLAIKARKTPGKPRLDDASKTKLWLPGR